MDWTFELTRGGDVLGVAAGGFPTVLVVTDCCVCGQREARLTKGRLVGGRLGTKYAGEGEGLGGGGRFRGLVGEEVGGLVLGVGGLVRGVGDLVLGVGRLVRGVEGLVGVVGGSVGAG